MIKKLICLVLSCLIPLGLCACAGAPQEEAAPQGLQVGFAREQVMPQGNVIQEASKKPITGIMGYLTVTCIALKGTNDETMLLYTMDKRNSSDSWTAPIRTAIATATGIPEERIMLAATHTHSSAPFSGWDGADKYKADFQAAMVKAGQDALADMSGAETYYGSTETEHLTFVRQYRLQDGTVTSSGVKARDPSIVDYAAESDGQLQIIRFTREGKKDVLLMSFNAHPTFHGSDDCTLLSPDFPGPTRDYIESQGDYLVAYFTGDAGNQAPTTKYAPDIPHEAEDYQEHGKRLGQYLLDALPDLTKAEGDTLRLVGQQYTAVSNKERLDMLEKSKEVMEVYETKGKKAANELAEQYGLYQYHEAKAIIERVEMPDTNEAWLNVMSIGNDLSFAFAPYEMFSENGSHLRASTPYGMTFLVSCCNGGEGYLPSAAAWEYGCYESYITRFERGTAEIFIEEFLAMLEGLKAG